MNEFNEICIKQGAFLVGSRAWGGATDASDHDFIIKNYDLEFLISALEGKFQGEFVKYQPSDRDTGYCPNFYLFKGKHKINFIVLDEFMFQTWKAASDMMYHAPKTIVLNRDKRRYCFAMLKTFIQFHT